MSDEAASAGGAREDRPGAVDRKIHPGFESMQQLSIYIQETDHVKRRPLYLVILELIRENDGAGATVYRGIAGYSSSSHAIHTMGFADIQLKLPLVMVIVETTSWVDRMLPILEELVQMNGGLLTIQDLEGHRYLHPSLQK
jgi:uncharacterized protein